MLPEKQYISSRKLMRRRGIQGSVAPAQVKRALEENPDAKLVVITSPHL